LNNDGQVTPSEIGQVLQKTLFQGNPNDRTALLLNMKSLLIAVNPNEVMNGIVVIWQVLLTMIATLRSSIAKEIALGVNLGKMFHKNVSVYIKPYILQMVFNTQNNTSNNVNKSNTNNKNDNNDIDDEESLKQWVDFLIEFVCKLIGISLSFILIRCISAFHSALKGSLIITKYIFSFLIQQQLVPANVNVDNHGESNILFLFVQYSLACYGFYYQLISGFTIRFWFLRLLLLPFTFVELVLSYLATR